MNYEEARAMADKALSNTSTWRAVAPLNREALIVLLAELDRLSPPADEDSTSG